MKKPLIIVSIIILALLLIILIFKGCLVYQRDIVCKAKIEDAVSGFIFQIKNNEYNEIDSNSMFKNRAAFVDFKKSISEPVEIKVIEGGIGVAYVLVEFEKDSYALMLTSEKAGKLTCWGMQFTVATVSK